MPKKYRLIAVSLKNTQPFEASFFVGIYVKHFTITHDYVYI